MSAQTNVYQLPVEQLEGLKQQLDNDIRSLGTAYDGLYNGRVRYQDNHEAIDQYDRLVADLRRDGAREQEVLVCLTSSLFVRGSLVPSDKVLVDVGTGYFIEQTMDQGKQYFSARAGQIGESLETVQRSIEQKQRMQNQVVDALQYKTQAMQRYQGAQ